MPGEKDKPRSSSGERWAQAKSKEKDLRMSPNLIWQWQLYHKRRFFWYRLFAGLVSGVLLLLTALATALPTWLLAEVPQRGQLMPGRGGMFNFCLDTDRNAAPEDLISQDACSRVQWVLSAENEDVPEKVSTVYILYTIARIAMLFCLLDVLIVAIRCAFFKSTVRFAPDLVVAGMMYGLANGLVIKMKRNPYETLRMFHFLDAIQFTEEDTGQGSLKAEPAMEYDVSWYITWMTIIILALVSVFMYYAGKHYDEMKKMELWFSVRQAQGQQTQQNPIYGGNQAPKSSPRKERENTDGSKQRASAEQDNTDTVQNEKQTEEGQASA